MVRADDILKLYAYISAHTGDSLDSLSNMPLSLLARYAESVLGVERLKLTEFATTLRFAMYADKEKFQEFLDAISQYCRNND